MATGRGFLLLRGFPVEELTGPEVELAYLGLGTHLGIPAGQNKTGDVLTHIHDEHLPDASTARLYRTNQRQDFHTDGADIWLAAHTFTSVEAELRAGIGQRATSR